MIVDRLTKSSHFLPFQTHWPISRLVELFIKEVVRLHSVPSFIVFDRDPRFTSHFWGKFLVTPWFSSAENSRITSGFVEVFGALGTTKDEFRSSPVPFLGFLALAASCVGLPGVRHTRFSDFCNLTVWAPAEWGALLIKRLQELVF